jgi:hypothetical protein
MPISYQPYLPDQDFLLPHSMREWLTGSIIVMDNATFHKSPLTRQLIE